MGPLVVQVEPTNALSSGATPAGDPCPDVDALLDLVEGKVREDQADLLRRHVETCADCAAEVAAAMKDGVDGVAGAAEVRADTLTDGDVEDTQVGPVKVGRFHILERVGAGAMGEVYAAYDPQLNRRVAIKLLKRGNASIDQVRFAREARSLAQISHPNVVPVHDAGVAGDRLFIAMEFVEGMTLREWALHPNRTADPRQALGLLIQAGEGLAAAHQRGMVHRDFKPGNVLVGDDGRVRVVDFGVARSTAGATAIREVGLPTDLTTIDPEHTRTGSAVGTPAYMAPEQFGGRVDAASDQFAFCVVAWEVLFGERPFRGPTVQALLAAMRSGAVSRPSGVVVSSVVEAALRRGLAFEPGQRFPDMAALLDELRRSQHRRAPWAWLAVAGVVALSVTSFAATREAPCSDSRDHLAGVWDERVRDRLQRTFGALRHPDAAAVARRVEEQIEAYTRAWVLDHRDACEAGHVRGEISAELAGLRTACLDGRLEKLRALMDRVVATTDADVLRIEEEFENLTPLRSCRDTEYVRLPPATQTKVNRALRLLDNAKSLAAKKNAHTALELSEMALEQATLLETPCLQSEINLHLATVATELGERARARVAIDFAHDANALCRANTRDREEPAGVVMSAVASRAVPPEPAVPSTGAIRLAPRGAKPLGHDIAWWQSRLAKWLIETPTRSFVFGEDVVERCYLHEGGEVAFLPGAINVDGKRSTATRTCSVPEGTALFFPVIDEFEGSFDPDESLRKLRQDVSACARTSVGVLEIDGERFEDLDDFYSESLVFEVNLPKDNAFGVDETTVPGLELSRCVTAGHYVFVEPLPVGRHELHWTAVNACNNRQVIRHTIIVEPATAPTAG